MSYGEPPDLLYNPSESMPESEDEYDSDGSDSSMGRGKRQKKSIDREVSYGPQWASKTVMPFQSNASVSFATCCYIARPAHTDPDDPTLSQAYHLDNPSRSNWIDATVTEITTNIFNTHTLDVATDAELSGKFIMAYFTFRFLRKLLADGTIDKYKVRGCIQGNRLKSEHPWDTFSPTINPLVFATIRALSVFLKLVTSSFDIVAAYLHQEYPSTSPIILMQLPKPIALLMNLDPETRYRLKKYLYGKDDAGRAFYDRFSALLITGGYIMSACDPCLFFRRISPTSVIMILIHVDDGYVSSSQQQLIDELYTYIRITFELTVEPCITNHLGVTHTTALDGLHLSQMKLLKKMFLLAKVDELPYMNSPSRLSPRVIENPTDLCDLTAYRSLVGCGMYIQHSKPEIAHYLSEASSKFNKPPNNADYESLRDLCRYLYDTQHITLTLPTRLDDTVPLRLYVWVDASYLTDPVNSTSWICFCFSFAPRGMFYTKTSLVPEVKTSSTHIETHALFTAIKDVLYIITLLEELGFPIDTPVSIYEDNASCIALVEGPANAAKRVKHFIMMVNYCRQQVQAGLIKLEDIDSERNIADIGTKKLYGKHFIDLRDQQLNYQQS